MTVNEAVVTIDKDDGTGGITVEAGDLITYTILLENTGGWTAYDVEVTDLIPAGLTYVTGSITTTSGTADAGGAPNLSWSIPSIAVGPANAVVLSYQVTVDGTVQPNEILWNDARVEWTSISGTPSPNEERNGTDGLHNSGVLNDYSNEDADDLVVDTAASITKTLTNPVGGSVTILSVVTYEIEMELPDATIPSLTITDHMGQWIDYLATTSVTMGGVAVTPVFNRTGQDLTWEFTNLDASGGGTLNIIFTAEVMDIDANDDLDTIPNSAEYYYEGYGAYTQTGGPVSATDLTIHVPALTITKTIASIIGVDGTDRTALAVVEPGDRVTYDITVNNVGSGTAYDVTVTDSILAEFTYVVGSATSGGGITVSGPNPLIWTIASIPGYGSETVSFEVDVTSSVVEGSVYTNYAITTGEDELGNTIPADNTDHVPADTFVIGTGGVPEDSAEVDVTARTPILSLDKEVISVNGIAYPGLLTVQPGDYIVYRVTVNNTGTGTAYDVDISDTLPTGLGYGDHLATVPPPTLPSGTYTDASWTGGYAGTHDGTGAPNQPSPVTGTITWDGSAINNTGHPIVTGIILTGGASYVLDYVVYVNSGIIQGLPVDNLAESECIDGAGTTVPSNTDTTTLFTREPFLVTEKEVTAIDGDPTNTTVAVVGSIVEYTVTIENVGDGDAVNVNIYDTMPLGFEYVPGSATIGDPTAIILDELQWLNNYTILSGDVFTFTFELEVTARTSGGDQINTMWVEGEDNAATPIVKDGSAITPLDTDDDDLDTAPVYVDIPTLPLVLTKTATPRSVAHGGVVRYTVTFSNNRKIEFYNVTITDVLPSGFTYLPGTSILDGATIGDPSGAGTTTLTWNIGTVAPETTVVLEYHALASHAASSGANVNNVTLNMVDGAGRKYKLTANATVSIKRGVAFPLASMIMPALPSTGTTPGDTEGWGERPGERREGEEEEESERLYKCCLDVRKIAIRSQDFGDSLPGYPEIYYQTDIAMYAATELFIIEDYLSKRLALNGIDPDGEYLMTGLYNRVVEKLGEYAQYNLGNVTMQSELGIPMRFSPVMRETIRENGVSPETAAKMLLSDMARAAGLDEVPKIEPIFLEYFGSYPYLEDKIVSGELAWSEGLMDKNIMPAALGMTLLRTSHQLPEFLESADPMNRFFGRLMLMLSLEKLEVMSSEMMVTAEFSPPVKYLPHYSQIEMNEADGTLDWTVVDETSSLYDHASMLWGLSKFRSVLLHSSDPDVRASLDVVTERLGEVYTAFESVHYDEETGEYKSLHAPGGGDDERMVTALDLGYTVLAMRSIYNDNRDLRMNSHEPMRRIVDICDFMIENMISKLDGGVYTSYDYAEGAPDTGTKRTLVDNSLAIRAFLSAYVITGDEKYRKAALDVYDFMVENIWVEEHEIFADEERWDYDVVMTPQNIGATMGALRELTLYGDDREIIDYLDRMSLLTERILDQSQLQLYENRFFPWHSPVTLIPEDPNGRSYIKPIITPIRDRSITRDLAPILVRKMVLNLTPGGAMATGNEDKIYDFAKWKSDLRYEVPDLIASSIVDDTFETDTGMYFSSLIHDYRDNLNDELPTYNPYIADPEIQTYGAYLSDEVSRFNIKNLTINSRMGIELVESSLVADLADDRRMNSDDYLEAFLNARVPQMDDEYESTFLAPIFGKIKGLTGAGVEDRFGHVIYLEYASGKPFYTDDIAGGWDEDTFDESLRISSIAQTMIRQIMLIEDYENRDDLFSGDIFVRDIMVLTAAAKRRFLSDLAAHTEENGINHIPHTFDMVWDDDLDRYLPHTIDSESDLFDHVSLIWAMALWIDSRDKGLFDRYDAYLDDREADEEFLNECIDDLLENHYSEAHGTLVTGSVDTIEVSRALDILTRAAALLPDGETKERLTTLIEHQAEYIINNILTDEGTVPLVEFGGEVPYETQCLMERLGTHVFPMLAVLEAYEVTGNERFLNEVMPAFLRFDKDKWVQELGLYLSTGTVYKQDDWSKVELEYTNTELISTILLISALQPYMEGEDKILAAFHMTTFMNRLLEISSLERYPGNDESHMEIFSPQIIRKVKIVLEESEGSGEPGAVFTFLIAVDTACDFDTDIDHGLSRVRIEDTIPEGFHYVAGSTTINGRPSPDPVGTKTLNWYTPSIGNDSVLIIRYQLIADPDSPPGYYVNDLDVISFWEYQGELYPCDEMGIEETIRLFDDMWIDAEEECIPCRYGEMTLPQ
ncbi:MAG: DUF11 domain-containing protein [Deltaproteobacteria bacterium]|nr:DUF11 domain-containing protein [Candidatus Zymogenaceae bacterium]